YHVPLPLLSSNRSLHDALPILVIYQDNCYCLCGLDHTPEVGLEHIRVGLNTLWRALSQFSAKIHHHNMIGQPHHKFHIVFDQQDANTLTTELAQNITQGLLFTITQPSSGLIEHQ